MQMQIREACHRDISQIVEVLERSMGDSSDLPVTEKVWKYKHIENPFGKSLVLVAEEDNRIVGLRAFMSWEWKQNERIMKAYRAVDTATHPEFQGKGIFKKLTLHAIEEGKKLDRCFVFNTPNDLSRPGYLKMGWREAGKIKVGLKPQFSGFLKRSSGEFNNYIISENSSLGSLDELCKNWNYKLTLSGKLFTPKSSRFLKWRYEENPLQHYEVGNYETFYIAGYIKKRGNIKELRIAECIYVDSTYFKKIKNIITQWSSKFGVHLISFSPTLLPLPFAFTGNIGPILTTKILNVSSQEIESSMQLDNWSYSLGDLELF